MVNCPFMMAWRIMEEIINNLYLGSFAEMNDLRAGALTGFSACLTVGDEFVLSDILKNEVGSISHIKVPNLNSIGISHKKISMDDGVEGVIVKHLPIALRFIDTHIKDGKVYVHCFAGVSRSASIVYAYLLSKGYSPLDAFYLLKKQRPRINPYENFISEILDYFKVDSKNDIMNKLRPSLYFDFI